MLSEVLYSIAGVEKRFAQDNLVYGRLNVRHLERNAARMQVVLESWPL